MGKLKDMKKKFEEHCGEYRLSNQDGLFIDWQMDFFDKYYIPISEIKEGSYEDGYLDGFEKGKGVVMGTTDCIPISEAETKEFEVRNEAYEDGFKSANIVGKTIPISEATVRPTWEETSGYRGYIACSCGQILQTVGQTREHWQMGHFDRVKEETISIDEIKILIAKEITVANSEGQPTSRLTSLYNKLPIDKSKEEEWVWCTECGKEKVYDGTICNSCKEWLVK